MDALDEDGSIIALPNMYYPSDHMALVFDVLIGAGASIGAPPQVQ